MEVTEDKCRCSAGSGSSRYPIPAAEEARSSRRAGGREVCLPIHPEVSLEGPVMENLLAVSGDPFQLDVEIVTEGPVAAALLADTDDGCDTVKGSDC